jgi:YegS/Rv2252/BmrU family lipid kinase
MLCCIGGDGTLNEVICGLMNSKENKPLCYLPAGSTNDFASVCGIKNGLSSTLSLLRHNRVSRVDLGQFDERYFTYIASFGLFTKASYSAEQSVKNMMGHFAYVLEGAKEISDLGKKYRVTVEYDGGRMDGDFIFGGVANTTSLGGLFTISKNRVVLDDGKFEVLLIREPKTLDDMIRILNMMQSGNFDGDLVVFLQSSKVCFHSETPIAWCLDGEFAGERSDVTVVNCKRALPLYCAPHDRVMSGNEETEEKEILH